VCQVAVDGLNWILRRQRDARKKWPSLTFLFFGFYAGRQRWRCVGDAGSSIQNSICMPSDCWMRSSRASQGRFLFLISFFKILFHCEGDISKIVQCSLPVIEAGAVFYCKLTLTVKRNSASLIPADDGAKITVEVVAATLATKMNEHLKLSRQF
jgi:hypothetical protein